MQFEAPKTLQEDWRSRRERLLIGGTPIGQAYIDALVRILDYLLNRYGNTPEGQRLPRFPLASGLYFDRRAVVVHHHLIGSRTAKDTATVENVLPFGLFRCGFQNARTNSKEFFSTKNDFDATVKTSRIMKKIVKSYCEWFLENE